MATTTLMFIKKIQPVHLIKVIMNTKTSVCGLTNNHFHWQIILSYISSYYFINNVFRVIPAVFTVILTLTFVRLHYLNQQCFLDILKEEHVNNVFLKYTVITFFKIIIKIIWFLQWIIQYLLQIVFDFYIEMFSRNPLKRQDFLSSTQFIFTITQYLI